MNLKHLNYRIDKPRFREVAEKWKSKGRFYQFQKFKQEDKWWQTYPRQGEDLDINEVAEALMINVLLTHISEDTNGKSSKKNSCKKGKNES